jgi:NAD(P)H-dependent FMN reductase
MSSSYTVGYIIGSLSTESINRTLSKALIRLAPENLKLVEIPIRDLPVYNRDFDADYPPAGRALKDAIASVDAVLFVTPEYNRGIPGSLKNAIDWASRPYGTNSFARKAVGGDRRLTRKDRNCTRPTASAQRAELLQRPADGRSRGLHSVHAQPDHRRR